MLKMQVIGFLGRDAEVNTVSGHSVINFNVCHTEKFKDAQGNQKEKSIWVQCAYWTDKTGIAPYLKKGTQVYAEGQPEAKSYPKNDGTTGVNLVLRIGMVQLLSSGQTAQNQTGHGTENLPPNAAPAPTRQQAPAMTPIEDLPF
jgi:single-strand DNA-binding protein